MSLLPSDFQIVLALMESRILTPPSLCYTWEIHDLIIIVTKCCEAMNYLFDIGKLIF